MSMPAFISRATRAKLIAAHEPGSFLFLTSLHAGTPRNLPHYSTSKAAMAMLVRELAKTFGRFGIRVNALVPVLIWPRRLRRRSVACEACSARPHRPQRRPGADGAGGAANRVSAYVTGAAIVVDGGLSLTNSFDPPDLGEVLTRVAMKALSYRSGIGGRTTGPSYD